MIEQPDNEKPRDVNSDPRLTPAHIRAVVDRLKDRRNQWPADPKPEYVPPPLGVCDTKSSTHAQTELCVNWRAYSTHK